MDKYVHLRCTLADHGIVVPLQDYEDPDKLNSKLKLAPNSDFYRSLFYFPEEFKHYFDQHNSVKGYNGTAHLDQLVWDFDSEADPNKAKEDAIILLKKLQDDGIIVNSSVQVFYSGHKGFHVNLQLDQEVTPEVMKTVCSNLAKSLTTFDAVIYNVTRCFRIPNTKHHKTGLYKIELDPDELLDLTLSQIQNKAARPVYSRFKAVPVAASTLISKYNIIPKPKFTIVHTDKLVSTSSSGIRGLDTINFKNCPKTLPRCIYALQHGVCKPGERQIVFFRLATYYRNQGMAKELTGRMLKGIAELNARLYPDSSPITKEEVWQQAIASAYKEGGQFKQIIGATGISQDDDLIKKYCDCLPTQIECTLHHRNSKTNTMVRIDEVAEWFTDFAKNYDNNVVRTGIEFIDSHMRMQVGATYHLVGATGSGKTSLLLNVLENSTRIEQHSVFFSLDTHKRMIYLKLAQKLTNYSQTQIFQFYKENNIAKMSEIKQIIAKTYNKAYFDFSTTLTLENMRDKVLAIEEKTKNKIKLVAVDYMGRVSGPYSDNYANTTYNALKSVEVANLTDAAWIFVHQISRNAGDSQTPLRSSRVAKQSGDIEESASGVITCWRPYVGLEHKDHVMRVYLAKNRMGSELEGILYWDGAKGEVRDMTFEEQVEYDHPEDEIKILKERIVR